MTFSILIGTHGEARWAELAWDRAYSSADTQGAMEVIIRHEPKASLAVVRNRMAKDSIGEMLVFLDADDELAPGYIDAMRTQVAARPGQVWTESGPRPVRSSELRPHHLLVPAVQYVNGDRETEPAVPQQGRWPQLNECVIGTAVPRSLFFNVGGFRELPSLEDYDLWLRCWDAGAKLTYVTDAVYRAFVSEEGRNRDQSCYARIWRDHVERGISR